MFLSVQKLLSFVYSEDADTANVLKPASLCPLCIVSVADKTQPATFRIFPSGVENVSVLLVRDSVSMHYLLPDVSTRPTCLVFKDRKVKEPNTQTQYHAQKNVRVKT
jgi:hypothetical protein